MFADEVNWKEVAAELWHGFRHLTLRKIWDWLAYGPVPMRPIHLVVIIPLILIVEVLQPATTSV
ncbi:MAG: hypothetical protein AB1720_10055 [Pseudomonadota bacterium]|jgi:hypothetical protein